MDKLSGQVIGQKMKYLRDAVEKNCARRLTMKPWVVRRVDISAD